MPVSCQPVPAHKHIDKVVTQQHYNVNLNVRFPTASCIVSVSFYLIKLCYFRAEAKYNKYVGIIEFNAFILKKY